MLATLHLILIENVRSAAVHLENGPSLVLGNLARTEELRGISVCHISKQSLELTLRSRGPGVRHLINGLLARCLRPDHVLLPTNILKVSLLVPSYICAFRTLHAEPLGRILEYYRYPVYLDLLVESVELRSFSVLREVCLLLHRRYLLGLICEVTMVLTLKGGGFIESLISARSHPLSEALIGLHLHKSGVAVGLADHACLRLASRPGAEGILDKH